MCPECDSDSIVQSGSGDERICEDCGLVLEEQMVDHGPEWRAFNQSEQDSKSRVGAPTTQTIHDKGLTTSINWKNKDAHGHTLSTRKRQQMSRLRVWQDRIRTDNAGERNLQFALSEIDRMASALGVPQSTREIASVLYRRSLDEDLIRGRSIEGVATSCLYGACRQESIPRSLHEVTDVSRVSSKEIGRTYWYISRELNLGIKPTNPKEYIPRFASELNHSQEVIQQATEIIDICMEEGLLSGKSPIGSAGAALYGAGLLCDQKRTQREVARVAQVTKVTIRNRYPEQLQALK